MTNVFKINEEIIFYSNAIELANFKKIQEEIFHKLDQIPYSGSENRDHKIEYLQELERTTGKTKLIGTTTEIHIDAVRNQINEIREQIKRSNLERME